MFACVRVERRARAWFKEALLIGILVAGGGVRKAEGSNVICGRICRGRCSGSMRRSL